eukprot:3968987-Prymnesium_polylepis.1
MRHRGQAWVGQGLAGRRRRFGLYRVATCVAPSCFDLAVSAFGIRLFLFSRRYERQPAQPTQGSCVVPPVSRMPYRLRAGAE